MLDKFLTSKRLIGNFKISQKNPLVLTCEKITQTPRIFNTSQIKSATENIIFQEINETEIPVEVIKSVEFVLKDLFIYMHQTGLYNRQLKLWKCLGSVTSCSVYKPLEGFLKKIEQTDICLLDLFIDPKNPCISLIIDKNSDSEKLLKFNKFKFWLDKIAAGKSRNKLKGVFYLTDKDTDELLISQLNSLICASDPILKYESYIPNTNSAHLNIIKFFQQDLIFKFHHVYPEIRHSKI